MIVVNEKHAQTEEQLLQTNILCSICVATYRRPQLLKRLLQSLNQQALPDNVSIEIIVVDNDSEKSAEAVVAQFSDSENGKFYYYIQPVKNISLTRNLAIKKACGAYILFIDDDEIASPEWVKHLLKTIVDSGSDGVFGFVDPEFSDETPEWMKRRDLFFSGPTMETGTEAKGTYTGNCIIKASLLKKMGQPFDPSYGMTGGEDIHLFRRLSFEGARYVNCREAVVTEFLPDSRTRMYYFYIRAMSGGNRNTRWRIESSGKRTFRVRSFMLLKSVSYGFVSLLFLIILFPDNVLRVKWLIKLASNLGRFMAVFGWYYKAYR